MRNRVLIVEDRLDDYLSAKEQVECAQVPSARPESWQVDYAHDLPTANHYLRDHFGEYALLILDNEVHGHSAIEKLVVPLLGKPKRERPPIIIWSAEGHFTPEQRAFIERMGIDVGNVLFCKKGHSVWRLGRMIQDVLDFEWRRGRLTDSISAQIKAYLYAELVFPYPHDSIDRLWSQLDKLRSSFVPVYISGAEGTRADAVAHQLHRLYVGAERPNERLKLESITFDPPAVPSDTHVANIEQKSLAAMDVAYDAAKEKRTTLIIHNVGRLPAEGYQKLRRYLTAYPRPHFILLGEQEYQWMLPDNPLRELIEKVKAETIHLPTLAERIVRWPEEMRKLFSCLEDFGMPDDELDMGEREPADELLFLRPDEEALAALMKAPWPLNAVEFRALCAHIYNSDEARAAANRERHNDDNGNQTYIVSAEQVSRALYELAENGVVMRTGYARLPTMNYRIRLQDFIHSYYAELAARCGGDAVRMSRLSGLSKLDMERLERKARGNASSGDESTEL